MLCCLTYASRTTRTIGLPEVQDLWLKSIACNERADITGALFFGGASFVHVIEGEETGVENLFERVRQDDRHRDIEVIAFNDIVSRLFRETPLKLINGSGSERLRQSFDYDVLAGAPVKVRQKAVFRLSKF